VGLRVRRVGAAGAVTLLVDGQGVAAGVLPLLARARTGYTGVEVGCDRGVPVGEYDAPARFPGTIRRVRVTTADDRWVDEAGAMLLEGATG
jgi:arylsulfatase